MKKLIAYLVAVVCLCASVFAQGARYGDSNPTQTTVVIPGTSGLILKVIPSAVIQFCTWPANAVPCTNKATTYSDITLNSACSTSTQVTLTGSSSCVGTSDALGNWGVWVPPGLYQYTFTYQGNSYGPFYALPTAGGAATLNCAGALNGTLAAWLSTTTICGDPLMGTDFHGNGFSQSWTYRGPFNGFYTYVGGGVAPGTAVANKLPANAISFVAPATVGTSYYFVPPATRCAVGQVWGLAAETTDANGDKVDQYQCQTSVAASTEVQVNGVDTSVQSPINIRNTATVTCTNPSAGNIDCNATGTSVPQISTPTAPTLSTNGSAGSTSYTYKVVGCQDGPTCAYHTPASAGTTIATGNATITSGNSINLTLYADTLYGPRCYNIYRTASAGTPSSTGLIANCVWKAFIDTGLAGDSSTAPSTNTTSLDPLGLTDVVNPCNRVPSAPWMIDGLPCTPKAIDLEFTSTFGSAGDANDGTWTRINWGTSTATYSNGFILIAPQIVGGQNQLRLLTQAYPSTPWTIVCTVSTAQSAVGGSGGMTVSDGTKYITYMASNNLLAVDRWTTATNAFSSTPFSNPQSRDPGTWIYLKIQDTGTNLIYSHSYDGVNYGAAPDLTESRVAFLTPSKWGIMAQGSVAAATSQTTFDYCRRTQ